MIVTNDFKLLATVLKNSMLDVSWLLNPPLCMELKNENCTCSFREDQPLDTRRKLNVDTKIRRCLQEVF